MLEKITWLTFFLFLLGAAAIYYLVVGYVFYRDEFKKRFRSEKEEEQEQLYEEEEEKTAQEEPVESEEYEGAFDELQLVVNDIRYGILEKAGRGASKAELMDQLKQRLASYEGLQEPAFRIALTDFITDQAAAVCGVSFSEEELEEEWSKLLR